MAGLKTKIITYALAAGIGFGGATLYLKSKGDDYYWKHLSDVGKQKYVEFYIPQLPANTLEKIVQKYLPQLPEKARNDILQNQLKALPEEQQMALFEQDFNNLSYGTKAKYFGKETWKATKTGASWLYNKVTGIFKKSDAEKKQESEKK